MTHLPLAPHNEDQNEGWKKRKLKEKLLSLSWSCHFLDSETEILLLVFAKPRGKLKEGDKKKVLHGRSICQPSQRVEAEEIFVQNKKRLKRRGTTTIPSLSKTISRDWHF